MMVSGQDTEIYKVKPPEDYPPEDGRFVQGNDHSPVAVVAILDTFDFAISIELEDLVMAALAGML